MQCSIAIRVFRNVMIQRRKFEFLRTKLP